VLLNKEPDRVFSHSSLSKAIFESSLKGSKCYWIKNQISPYHIHCLRWKNLFL